MTTQQVWVYIEIDRDGIASVSKELLSEGRRLSDQLKGELTAVILGHQIDDHVQELFDMRCQRVIAIRHKELYPFRILPVTTNLTAAIRKYSPDIILFGATAQGRELAPRVASAVRCGLTADCTSLRIGDYTNPRDKKVYKNLLLQIRPAFGGNIIATIVNPEMHPQMATVRPGVMKMNAPLPAGTGSGELVELEAEIQKEDLVLKVVEQVREARRANLDSAQIIVAGGAGVGSRENFQLLEELAEALGGQVGASRAAVDAGWIHKDHQVGQTGTTVRPRLYIACGISGSVQHIAGMMDSKQIVAINTDPNADIFKLAHYKIVGDLNKVIPMMLKAYRDKA